MVEDGGDGVGLDTGADESGAVEGSGGGSLLALDELFLGVGLLGAAVGVSEERGEDGEVRSVVEHCAEDNGGGPDERKGRVLIVAVFYMLAYQATAESRRESRTSTT